MQWTIAVRLSCKHISLLRLQWKTEKNILLLALSLNVRWRWEIFCVKGRLLVATYYRRYRFCFVVPIFCFKCFCTSMELTALFSLADHLSQRKGNEEVCLWMLVMTQIFFFLTYTFKGRKYQKPCNIICTADLLCPGLHQTGRKYFKVCEQ